MLWLIPCSMLKDIVFISCCAVAAVLLMGDHLGHTWAHPVDEDPPMTDGVGTLLPAFSLQVCSQDVFICALRHVLCRQAGRQA